MFYRTGVELLPIEVLHCGNRDFRPFCSCDLDRHSITFIYELDPHCLEIYQMCEYELPASAFEADRRRQRDRHT